MRHADRVQAAFHVLAKIPKRKAFLTPLLALPLALGCSDPGAGDEVGSDLPPQGDEDVTARQEPLLNNVIARSCTANERMHLIRSLTAGSFVARSRGFRQCVDTAMRQGIDVFTPDIGPTSIGPYVKCGDRDSPQPAYGDPGLDERINQVLFAATSTNDIDVTCSWASGRAHAGPGNPTGTTRNGIPYIAHPEGMTLKANWRNSDPGMDNGVEATQDAKNADFFQIARAFTAGTIWHEAMHVWGYQHSEQGVIDCPNQAYQNSIPVIVQRCMEHVMGKSAAIPASAETSCYSAQRRVYSTASDNYQCTINPMFDVGVIPGVGVQCPGEELTIYMDDEDSDNANRRSGWIGRTESTSNTRFRFCRVQGTQFMPRRSSSSQANYAVLRMGNACPNDSVPASVFWDNEDSSNKNSSSGHVAPSSLTNNTRLQICVFHASPSAEDIPFPTAWMPEQYGVFGTAELPGAIESGFIRADGDHSDNGNQMPTGVTAPFFYTKSFYIQVSMARVR